MTKVSIEAINAIIEELQALIPSGQGGGRPPVEPPLNSAGGGGKLPDMEARVASLEAHMSHVRDDVAKLRDVPVSLGKIETKMDSLPTKEWTFKSLAAMLAALAVVVGLIVRFVPHA